MPKRSLETTLRDSSRRRTTSATARNAGSAGDDLRDGGARDDLDRFRGDSPGGPCRDEREREDRPDAGYILFQALDTSIVKTLDVREGDQVKKGQLLATLDPTFAAADVEQLEKQLASLDAQIARATAEQTGKIYAPEVKDPVGGQYALLQKSLFDQRSAQFKAQVASFDQKIAQTQATIKRLQGDEARYAEREKISQQIEGMRQQLVERQAGSLLNLLIASDARLEMLRTMENGRNGLVEAKHSSSRCSRTGMPLCSSGCRRAARIW